MLALGVFSSSLMALIFFYTFSTQSPYFLFVGPQFHELPEFYSVFGICYNIVYLLLVLLVFPEPSCSQCPLGCVAVTHSGERDQLVPVSLSGGQPHRKKLSAPMRQ